MVLRKTHTKTGAYVEFDLKLYPAVIEEIESGSASAPASRKRRRSLSRWPR